MFKNYDTYEDLSVKQKKGIAIICNHTQVLGGVNKC